MSFLKALTKSCYRKPLVNTVNRKTDEPAK